MCRFQLLFPIAVFLGVLPTVSTDHRSSMSHRLIYLLDNGEDPGLALLSAVGTNTEVDLFGVSVGLVCGSEGKDDIGRGAGDSFKDGGCKFGWGWLWRQWRDIRVSYFFFLALFCSYTFHFNGSSTYPFS